MRDRILFVNIADELIQYARHPCVDKLIGPSQFIGPSQLIANYGTKPQFYSSWHLSLGKLKFIKL